MGQSRVDLGMGDAIFTTGLTIYDGVAKTGIHTVGH